MSNADFHNLPGWNRLPACCFGRRARNLAGRTIAISRANDLCRASHNEIRRDAGFDGRDARATRRVIDFLTEEQARCFVGGTGFQPVVSGVPPETVAGYTIAISRTNDLCRTSHNEIRRDAGFNGRDARATQ